MGLESFEEGIIAPIMNHQSSRRRFIQLTAGAASASLFPTSLWGAKASHNELPNLAAVGVGGKGWTDSQAAAQFGNMVAYCDVQEGGSRKGKGGWVGAAKMWPKARRYTDWREMLDKEKNLDGITVSTPDHMHAPITMAAMQLGISPYTQKPLTKTVHESRQLAAYAAKAGLPTQMGNQNHSGETYRTLVKLIQSGVIGKITAAHAWSNRPIWPQGMVRPTGKVDVPSGFHWDLWLGVAHPRPYLSKVYHPFKWRGWYEFGAGALGDMGCHIIDPVVWALGLGAPISVRYEGPPPTKETFPEWERLHYEFPGTRYTAGDSIKMVWHDGNKKPTPEEANLPGDVKLPANGCILVGEKGVVVTAHGSRGIPKLYPESDFQSVEIEKVAGSNHYEDWVKSIKGEGMGSASFDYAGPLTETVLLGTVACRVPEETLLWDSSALKFPNSAEASALIRQGYRKGWEVEGL